jgi:hypothetical protein
MTAWLRFIMAGSLGDDWDNRPIPDAVGQPGVPDQWFSRRHAW